jgi:hypothetical protein
VIDSRRRNSDLDYFFDFPQVSIDSSESLLSSFEMEGLPDPLVHSASRMDSNSDSPHRRERINVIQNVLAKGLEDAKINALEELSSILTSDKSICKCQHRFIFVFMIFIRRLTMACTLFQHRALNIRFYTFCLPISLQMYAHVC